MSILGMNTLTLPTRNGLVGEWLLNGNALDTNDGTKHNGSATTVIYTNTDRGYQKQCGAFNGKNSNINISYDSTFNISTGDFTWCIWFKSTVTETNMTFGGKQVIGALQGYWVDKDNAGNINFNTYQSSGNNTILQVSSTNGYFNGQWRFLVARRLGTELRLFIDGNSVGSTTGTLRDVSGAAPQTIGKRNSALYFNGNLQSNRVYNRALNSTEIEILYLEGLRKLNGESMSGLFDGLVANFKSYGDNNLFDVHNGNTATRTGGTSTTDDLGFPNAISNPNYSWTSITYTDGYSWENSGSGWSLVTNPSGLSATGINRTTTLREIFLFNRTPSASELTAISDLCKLKYLYSYK